MKPTRVQTIEAEVVEPVGSPEPVVAEKGAAPGADSARRRTLSGMATAMISGVLGVLYILNPTGGFIELLPDNLPLVGNLDEAGATLAVFYALRYLFVGRGRPRP